MKKHNNPLFFIHIPKTAGTSFRTSAINFFGKDLCHFDYGTGNPDTTSIIEQYVYNKPDFFLLEKELKKANSKFLCGHVSFRRYSPLVPAAHIVSFLRDPLKQFISHYEHKTRHHAYTETLEFMLNTPAGPEIQYRCLQGLPLEAYGFIGVTERYEDSLFIFNKFYDANLEYSKTNTNPNKQADNYTIPSNLVESFNKKSFDSKILYEKANKILDTRLKAIRSGYEYIHAGILTKSPTHIDGFAFNARKNNAIRVQLLINGKVVQTSLATDDRPLLRAASVSRNGYVGFRFNFPTNLKTGDEIFIRIPATDQEILKTYEK